MNKLKISSKMHLFIIISTVIVAIGLAVGLVCQFVANGFFNPGDNYSSYKAVKVLYSDLQISSERVEEICEQAFADSGVDYYTVVTAENASGEEVEYRFVTGVDSKALSSAAQSIQSSVQGEYSLASASFTEYNAEFGGTDDMMYAGIALAAAIAFQFLYFIIRYKFTMAVAAFVADLHNLLIFYAVLAITRVQVSLAVVALSVLVVLLTMVGCAVLFDKMRKNFRQDSYKAMPSFEQVDASLREGFPLVTLINVIVTASALVMLVFGLVSGGLYGLFMPCAAAIIGAAVCEYGTLFFVPAVYSRLKLRADEHAAKKVQKYSGAKKAEKVAE